MFIFMYFYVSQMGPHFGMKVCIIEGWAPYDTDANTYSDTLGSYIQRVGNANNYGINPTANKYRASFAKSKTNADNLMFTIADYQYH